MLSPASMEEFPDEVVQLNDLVAERLPRVELAEVLIEDLSSRHREEIEALLHKHLPGV